MKSDPELIRKNDQTPAAGPEPDERTSQTKHNIQPSSSVPELPPPGHCYITCKAEKNWWDKLKPIVEIVGIVLLATYTVYTIKMYRANKEAAEAAKSAAATADATLKSNQQQFRTEQRPLIWVNVGIPVTGNPMSQTPLLELKNQNLPLAFNIAALNGGRSPASEYRSTKITFIFDDTAVASTKVAQYEANYLSPALSVVVMPNQVVYLGTTTPMVLTDEILRDMESGKKSMFILGKLEYRDIFSPRIPAYESQFCFRVNYNGRFPAVATLVRNG